MKHLLGLFLAFCAAPLGAHPHIFVNTGLEIIVDDQNRLTHVRVTWTYDALFSLLITEDMGLDDDYDGTLTDAEIATLTGFDMNWIEGYNGDLVGELGGVGLAFSRPSAATAAFDEGQITTTHLRRVVGAPVLDAPLVLRPYDGTFYTAYEVDLPISVSGREGCEITRDVPDFEAALALTQAELSAIPEDPDLAEEQGYGDIGARFATEVTVTCAVQ
ncbi:DUF1007 family protein [Sulfitobacter albidus]|uniref:DUF1007 family protein n=1 Tax=Sulfitobacter albidus TaxID=2829501 RepID=A0A975PMD9_9RHOB|nr:DUF1007 family protein [Sulfitobacter albidus]QUJ76698.1 DUF1007 family protein [Sulfitobacter albidus]